MRSVFVFFLFHDAATTDIYTLSLHDALPISGGLSCRRQAGGIAVRGHSPAARRSGNAPEDQPLAEPVTGTPLQDFVEGDRKSTRLNSSHGYISYAVFCLKKKN